MQNYNSISELEKDFERSIKGAKLGQSKQMSSDARNLLELLTNMTFDEIVSFLSGRPELIPVIKSALATIEQDESHLSMFPFLEHIRRAVMEAEWREILGIGPDGSWKLSFDLTIEQTSQLVELIKDNEIARNRLKEIIENKLEDTFDFDSLIRHLIKTQKRTLSL